MRFALLVLLIATIILITAPSTSRTSNARITRVTDSTIINLLSMQPRSDRLSLEPPTSTRL